MFTVLLFMFAGILSGFVMRKIKIGFINLITTTLIWMLLFILGLEVGFNDAVVKNFYKLGFEAFFIAFFTTLGSVIGAKLLLKKKISQ